MRIELNREVLSKKLATTTSVINDNHSIPILSNALFQFKDGRIYFISSDLEITAKTSMEYEITEGVETDFVIDPNLLFKTIQSLNSDVIWIDYSPEKKTVTFGTKSQKKIFTISSEHQSKDFPLPKQDAYTEEISVHGGMFAKAISDCARFTNKNELRLAFRGVNIITKNGNLRLYGTEGQVIAFYEFSCDGDLSETIIPKNIEKIINEFKDSVSVKIQKGTDASSVLISDGVIEVNVTLINSKILDFEKIFAQGNPEVSVMIPRHEFLNSIKRGVLFKDITSETIILDFSLPEKMMAIKAENLDFKKSSSEEIECISKDSFFDYKTGFNSKFITPVITMLDGDNIKFFQSSYRTSGFFTDDKEKSYKCMFAVGPIILKEHN